LKTLLLCLYLLITITIFSQTKEISDNQQSWVGYMTSAKLSEKYYLWNDFHYVPDGFFVARTGLTRSFYEKLYYTAGFAYLNIPTQSAGETLNRTEYRPWMQMVANHKITDDLIMINRVRYDMRFRQDFADGELFDDFTFNHRLRLLIGLRQHFSRNKVLNGTPFVNLSNEVLVNFGENVTTNYLDQNRTWLTLGLRLENLSFQVGYMHRFVQLPQDQRFVRNHTLIVWITQRFDFRKQQLTDPDDDLFFQQP
jgi:hypothetical protein